MGRTAARFKQDDVARVLRAARGLGMGARVNLVTGTIDILPKPIEGQDAENTKAAKVRDFSL